MTVQHDIFLSDFKYFTLSKDADNKLSGIYEYESRTHEVFDAEVFIKIQELYNKKRGRRTYVL